MEKERNKNALGKLIGEGFSSEVFSYSQGKVLKLYRKNYSNHSVKSEMENAIYMKELGLTVPECYGCIEQDGRTGILYEKIEGKSLTSLILTERKFEPYIKILATLHQQVLQTESLRKLPSYKEELIYYANDNFKLIKKIIRLPEGNTLCHGDFQPGNIILTKNGTPFLIDFASVSHGVREYDIARCYYFLRFAKMEKEVSDITDIDKVRETASNLYLEFMDISFPSIEPFVEIFGMIRNHQ